MSVKMMALVFEMDLPPSEKVTALALADHAHDDGTEARPGLESLAVKTSLSKRQVQRILKLLLVKGVLAVQRPATGTKPAVYMFVNRGVDKLSTGDTDGSLGVTSGASRVDTGVTRTIKEPSMNLSSSEVASDPRPESKDDAPSHTVTRLCVLLADAIEANGSKRPTITKAWNREMRLMLERDGHSEKQISNMIAWCQADAFWRTNILSVTKLRAKYDQMRLKALAESKAQVTPTDLAGERRAKAERERTDALIREQNQAAHERAPMPDELKNLRKKVGRS